MREITDFFQDIDYTSIENFNLDFTLPHVFETETEQKRVYKRIENIVRNSYEYYKFISYLRSELNLARCVITYEHGDDVRIEFHHHPLTLFDLVDIVYTTYVEKNYEFTTFDIAKEILKLHYCKYVGLVPLTKTLHEKAHSDNLIFPKKLVLFDFERILNLDYIIKDDHREKILRTSNTTLEEFLDRCRTILWPS